MNESARVSVIIPAFNAAETLSPLLDALEKQTRPPDEIIVVDDCSTDDTAAEAASLGAVVVSHAINQGPGPARNTGVAAAASEVLLFTDADCVPPPDWIARSLRFMRERSVRVTTSGYAGPVERNLDSWHQHWEKRAREPSAPQPICATNGHSLAIERGLYLEVGGMASIRTSEDFHFGLKVSRLSEIWFDPDNGVHHRFRPGVRDYFRRTMLFAQNSFLSSRDVPLPPKRQATFSPFWTLAELALTATALIVAYPWPWVAIGLVALRSWPLLTFLARRKREVAPLGLFFYSPPQLVLRDVASVVGLVRGVVLLALGRKVRE